MTADARDGIAVRLLAESDYQHFRLLELTPDLLTALTSAKPEILELKATSDSINEGHAVLCTANKTYDLRQKNSSNTVYLLQPNHDGTLEAIAQCHSTLEVTPQKKTDAATHIRALTPVYSSTGVVSFPAKLTRQQLLDQIPASQQECDAVWRHLAGFEHPETRYAMLPSAQVRLAAYKDILDNAVLHSIDLTAPISTTNSTRLADRDDATNTQIASAVLRSSATGESDLSLDQVSFVRNVGRTLLEVRSENGDVPTADLISAWKDLVPEKWRETVTVSCLEQDYQNGSQPGTITFSSNAERMADKAVAAQQDTTKSSTKRKWHDKFRAERK